jgi:hypothetical protein
MSFPSWLRSNSEYYLLCDAQARMARKFGIDMCAARRSLKDRFWMQVFVPIYRALPWGLRRAAMQALPGSHRQVWPKQGSRPPKP